MNKIELAFGCRKLTSAFLRMAEADCCPSIYIQSIPSFNLHVIDKVCIASRGCCQLTNASPVECPVLHFGFQQVISHTVLSLAPSSLLMTSKVKEISKDSIMALGPQLHDLNKTSASRKQMSCPIPQLWSTRADLSVCATLRCCWCSFNLVVILLPICPT